MATSALRARCIALGALAGLAWSAALRGYMAEIAGFESHVDAVGTFAGVLLPGAVVGALLGWAEYLRRTGGRRGWRWLALAPLLFPIPALAAPGALVAFVTTGIGGGSIGVAVLGIAGGFALGRIGSVGWRIAVGAIAVAGTVALGLSAGFISADLAVSSPRGAWLEVWFVTLMLALAVGARIPFLPVVSREPD